MTQTATMTKPYATLIAEAIEEEKRKEANRYQMLIDMENSKRELYLNKQDEVIEWLKVDDDITLTWKDGLDDMSQCPLHFTLRFDSNYGPIDVDGWTRCYLFSNENQYRWCWTDEEDRGIVIEHQTYLTPEELQKGVATHFAKGILDRQRLIKANEEDADDIPC